MRATGSHVSFVDIAKITAIIQDIAGKLLVAVLLFFAFLVVYGILASLSLIEQMKESIAIKKKLYTYLGSPDRTVRISTYVTLGSILLTAGVLIVGAVVAGYIGLLSIMTFLSFSYTALWLSIGFVFALLVGLFGWCVLRFR